MIRHNKYDLFQTLSLNMTRAERNHEKTRASPVLRDFFLCKFALILLENLHHFLNLRDNFGIMPFGIANTRYFSV